MSGINFTATRLDRLKYDANGPRIQRIWDSEVAGLGLEVSPTGRKSWLLRYRIHGKQRIITLGRLADLSLPDARARGVEYRSLVSRGIDPKERRDAPVEGVTLEQMFRQYTSTTYFANFSPDYKRGLRSTYRNHLHPELGHYPLKSIKRKQLRDMASRLIEEGKEGAARALVARSRSLFAYAVENDLLEHSPADHIRMKYTTTGKRTDWLDTPARLREAWHFDGAPQVRALVRWCLLTGCRKSEARLTRYTDIVDGVWTVLETKNRNPLVLPVMPALEQVVDDMRKTFGATPWLFPATSDTQNPMPSGSLGIFVLAQSHGEWSLHVLRHTVESYLRELEVAEETRDLILNHVRQSSGHRYSHGKALGLKRNALAIWHEYLLEAVEVDHG